MNANTVTAHENIQRTTKPKPKNENLKAMKQAGEIGSINTIHHKEQKYDKWDDAKKIEYCTRKTNLFGIRKGLNGLTEWIPRNCNNCPLCFAANSLKLKVKVDKAIEKAKEDLPDGQWRKKVVTGQEAKSLKKRIKRNQSGRHIEAACTDGSGNTEVWSYTESENGKDTVAMDSAYGEAANPEDIDFEALYKENRSTGKKLSTGSSFRQSSPETKKSDTERVLLPDIIIKDAARTEEAEKIINDTNFIQIARSSGEAVKLYLYQFQFILKELEEAGIKIAAIKMNYFNIAKSDVLNSWNMNIQYWQMYTDSPLPKDNGAKVDTSKLVYPYKWIPNNKPIAQ